MAEAAAAGYRASHSDLISQKAAPQQAPAAPRVQQQHRSRRSSAPRDTVGSASPAVISCQSFVASKLTCTSLIRKECHGCGNTFLAEEVSRSKSLNMDVCRSCERTLHNTNPEAEQAKEQVRSRLLAQSHACGSDVALQTDGVP